MRTVITISLNGNAYQLDAVGFDALRAYLQVAEQRLAGNPDQAEILADLEQAIADKLQERFHRNVNFILGGQFAGPPAYRSELTGAMPFSFPLLWNIERAAK